MSITTSREQRRKLARDNAKQPTELTEIPRHIWPYEIAGLERVWRSREFLAQQHSVPHTDVLCRLSINRATLSGERWSDGISWDELQAIKNVVGFVDVDAVEIYPRKADVVNVSSMRHLWLMREPVEFAWR